MPELLGQEGHEGMEETEGGLEANEEDGANGGLLSAKGIVLGLTAPEDNLKQDWGLKGREGCGTDLGKLEVEIAEIVEEEVVDGKGGVGDLVALQGGVGGGDGLVEAGKDPVVGQGEGEGGRGGGGEGGVVGVVDEGAQLLQGSGRGKGGELERVRTEEEKDRDRKGEERKADVGRLKVPEAESRGLPDLVAEVAVGDDPLRVEVDGATLSQVLGQGEAEGVGSAGGDA